MASPAARRAAREGRRRLRLRSEHETNQPPLTDAEALAVLAAQRAKIAAAVDAEVEKARARTEAALDRPLDPAMRAFIIETRQAEHLHEASAEPMTCALMWINAASHLLTGYAGLLHGTTMTVPALLLRALDDYRAGSPGTLNAMIDHKRTGRGSRKLPSAARERGLIAAWVSVLQLGDAATGAYSHAAALEEVIKELGRVGITRREDAVRRIHQKVTVDRKDSLDALQVYDAVLAAMPEEAATWPQERRQRGLRRQIENAAGDVFRS
jgi:hypothetical protein